jgi:AcrR family transcriptional regulator
MTPPATGHTPAGTPPGGRRPRRPSAARRADVLTAARQLFAERGFHATSTRELAQAADINDALLYRYFPSKDAILAALVNEAITAFQRLPDTPPANNLAAAELLELIGTAFVHTATQQLDLLTILVSEHHALADDHRFAEFIHHAAVNLGHLLDRMTGPEIHASGYLTARAYMGSLIAFVIAQDVLGLSAIQPLDPAEYVHHLATLTARGLSAKVAGEEPA